MQFPRKAVARRKKRMSRSPVSVVDTAKVPQPRGLPQLLGRILVLIPVPPLRRRGEFLLFAQAQDTGNKDGNSTHVLTEATQPLVRELHNQFD